MGTPTFTAYALANAEFEAGIPVLDGTVIATMDGQTIGMFTGTDQAIINSFIIKILRNRVAYIDR